MKEFLYALWMLYGHFVDELLVPTHRALIISTIILVALYTYVFIGRIEGIREEKRRASRKWWKEHHNKYL